MGVAASTKGPRETAVRVGRFLHLLSAEGGVKRSERGDYEKAVASIRPGHCFRKQEHCSELGDVSLGRQAGNLAKKRCIFPKCPKFYKCQLFQNTLPFTKGSDGVLADTQPIHTTLTLPAISPPR